MSLDQILGRINEKKKFWENNHDKLSKSGRNHTYGIIRGLEIAEEIIKFEFLNGD